MFAVSQPVRSIAWFLCVAISVAGCGRRVDPRARRAPARVAATASGSIPATAVTAASVASGGASALKAAPAELAGNGVRHVDPEGLVQVVRHLAAKGVVINVWATWCGPCREELPMLARVAKAYARKGIAILPLSVDEPSAEPKVSMMLREFGFEPPFYVGKPPLAAMKQALNPDWPGNVPVSFILDAQGVRRYFFNTEVYEEELTPKLDALLKGGLVDGESKHGTAPGLKL